MRISLLTLILFCFALPLNALAANAELGEKIFNKRCKVCHNSLTAKRKIGPGLKGVFEREAISGIGTLTESRLHEWIQNPRSVKPKTRMPKYGPMQDVEKRQAVIDFLKTL